MTQTISDTFITASGPTAGTLAGNLRVATYGTGQSALPTIAGSGTAPNYGSNVIGLSLY